MIKYMAKYFLGEVKKVTSNHKFYNKVFKQVFSLTSAGRFSGHHVLHSVCSGNRSFPRRHLLIPAEGAPGGALPLGDAEAAAGVAHLPAAVQPRNIPVAAQPVCVAVHWPAGRLLCHHPLVSSVPLPAGLAPLSAAQVSPGEETRTGSSDLNGQSLFLSATSFSSAALLT